MGHESARMNNNFIASGPARRQTRGDALGYLLDTAGACAVAYALQNRTLPGTQPAYCLGADAGAGAALAAAAGGLPD